MKIQLENINTDHDQTFRLMHDPKLSDLFFWHFHPEYELVYIDGTNGTRHVGEHYSSYEGSDLVLIGSNIPHLNFDYGVKNTYEKQVIHILPDFKTKVSTAFPEMSKIVDLLENAQRGIAFGSKAKSQVAPRMKKLYLLSEFDLFIEIIAILNLLANIDDFEYLHEHAYQNQFNPKQHERLRKIHAFIDRNYQKKISIAMIADECNLGEAAFCRYFKKNTGTSFVDFLNQYRVSQAKRLLMMDKNISETCFESGFESLSYFNRAFKKITRENPSDFKKNYFSGK